MFCIMTKNVLYSHNIKYIIHANIAKIKASFFVFNGLVFSFSTPCYGFNNFEVTGFRNINEKWNSMNNYWMLIAIGSIHCLFSLLKLSYIETVILLEDTFAPLFAFVSYDMLPKIDIAYFCLMLKCITIFFSSVC